MFDTHLEQSTCLDKVQVYLYKVEELAEEWGMELEEEEEEEDTWHSHWRYHWRCR